MKERIHHKKRDSILYKTFPQVSIYSSTKILNLTTTLETRNYSVFTHPTTIFLNPPPKKLISTGTPRHETPKSRNMDGITLARHPVKTSLLTCCIAWALGE
ncbi:hypothetical protein CEXT_542591 [Caerostris extrusa]|uniref:Uncharacterized protein n=1 Tax=Caerostris extrusa TaxID=172846 RepID=A0AAV4XVT8_CAEEX|nr:hypothetical protein CEXT_542591 [Caerostris extrusa]